MLEKSSNLMDDKIWHKIDLEQSIAQLKISNEISLHIRKVQLGKNPICNILFSHDILDHHGRVLDSFVRNFKKLNIEISLYFYDLRGHGLSSGHRGNIHQIEESIEDFSKVLNFINPDKNFYFWGHGFGALICYHYFLYGHALSDSSLLKNFKGIIASNFYLDFSSRSNPMLKILDFLKDKNVKSIPPVKINRLIFGRDQSLHQKVCENYETDPLVVHRMSYQTERMIEKAVLDLSRKAYFIDFNTLMIRSSGDPLVNHEKYQLFVKTLEKKYYKLIDLSDAKHDLYNDPDSSYIFKEVLNWIKK